MNPSPYAATIAIIKKDPGPIPEMKPPRDEIPAGVVPEKVILGVVLLVAFVILLLGRVFRVRHQELPSFERPETLVRRELDALAADAPTAERATSAAQAIRRYVISAFSPGSGALTYSELGDRFAQHPMADTASTLELREFLRECELAQFAGADPSIAADLVSRARHLVETLESTRGPVVLTLSKEVAA